MTPQPRPREVVQAEILTVQRKSCECWFSPGALRQITCTRCQRMKELGVELNAIADSTQEAGAISTEGGDEPCAPLSHQQQVNSVSAIPIAGRSDSTEPVLIAGASNAPDAVQSHIAGPVCQCLDSPMNPHGNCVYCNARHRGFTPTPSAQRDPNNADELKSAREELVELKKGAKINTHVRLFDLVRYQRSELHRAQLITDEEYFWLCAEAPMSKSPKGGSPSRQRLEDYDELRALLTTAETHAKSLEEELRQCHEAINAKIQGKSITGYLSEQFPATDGHIPLRDYFTRLGGCLVSTVPATPSAGPEAQP